MLEPSGEKLGCQGCLKHKLSKHLKNWKTKFPKTNLLESGNSENSSNSNGMENKQQQRWSCIGFTHNRHGEFWSPNPVTGGSQWSKYQKKVVRTQIYLRNKDSEHFQSRLYSTGWRIHNKVRVRRQVMQGYHKLMAALGDRGKAPK